MIYLFEITRPNRSSIIADATITKRVVVDAKTEHTAYVEAMRHASANARYAYHTSGPREFTIKLIDEYVQVVNA